MENEHTYAVIMAGGSGERFWPLSTSARPKQFVSIFGGKPLIRHAVDRLEGLVPPERIIIVTADALVGATREACPSVPHDNIIGEPMRRDTAAACALSLGLVKARDPNGVAAILTADQLMADVETFRRTLADAFSVASSNDAIVTIGIVPTCPATGFGYIECGDECSLGVGTRMRRALRFVEKPDAATARSYVESGRFRWNSGMFIWSVATMGSAFASHAPQLLPLVDAAATATSGTMLAERIATIYPGLVKISLDYAVMEKCRNIITAEGDFGWDDVGSWPAIAAHMPADGNGNIVLGAVAAEDSRDNIVVNTADGRILAVLGCENMVVVQTPTATLVCPKDSAQNLKALVKAVSAAPDGGRFI